MMNDFSLQIQDQQQNLIPANRVLTRLLDRRGRFG
jgi:hypothetical protein